MSKLNSSSITTFVNTGISLFILRIFAAGFIFFGHGWGKLINVVSGNLEFMNPIGLGPEITLIFATFAEAICAALVFFGFYTRFGALIIVLNMAGAAFFHHLPAGDGFGGMELPLLYLLLFFVIFLMGPGSFAADSKSR